MDVRDSSDDLLLKKKIIPVPMEEIAQFRKKIEINAGLVDFRNVLLLV